MPLYKRLVWYEKEHKSIARVLLLLMVDGSYLHSGRIERNMISLCLG